jgi:uncharacterized protein involved in outer membrane biogenesis
MTIFSRSQRHRLLAWTGGTLGVLVLGLAVGEASGWPVLRGPLQAALASSSGVPVLLDGRFHLRLLVQPQLSVGHLHIAAGGGMDREPGGSSDLPHLLDASNIEIGWRWLDIWRWRRGQPLHLRALRADKLDLRLLRADDGRASWQLGKLVPPLANPQPIAPATAPPPIPRFGVLAVRQGLVLVDDKPLQTQLRIELQGGEGDDDAARLRSGYSASAVGRWQGKPLNLQVRTGGARDALAEAAGAGAAGDLPVRVEGQVGAAHVLFDGRAGALLDERRLQGALQLSGPSLAQVGEALGVTLPRTPPFDLRGQLGHADGVWQLQAERVSIGSSRLQGEFSYDTRPVQPRLVGQLSGTRLALADLGPAVGTRVPGTPVVPGAARRVLPQTPLDLPSLRVMDADVQVAVDELDFGSPLVAPMRALQTRVLLQAGVLQLLDLKARVAGGSVGGSTRLDANPQPARYAADLRFDGIDVAGWLRGLQAKSADKPQPAATQAAALQRDRTRAREGGAQTVQSYLTGSMSGTLKATGVGNSAGDILGHLNGEARLVLSDGSLSHLATEALGLDLAQALGVLVRGDRPLPLRCARMDLAIQDGLVRPRRAVLDSRDSTTRIEGLINLRDETLALRAVTRPKDISPLSLRTPIVVGGTLANPVVGIEGKSLAGKVLGSVALGALLSPLAALLPLVDLGSSDKGDPCSAAAPVAASAPR